MPSNTPEAQQNGTTPILRLHLYANQHTPVCNPIHLPAKNATGTDFAVCCEMHYRVESRALPRARTFRNREKAVAFAKELSKKTPHEVRVRIVGASYAFDNQVLYIFNKGGGSSPSPK